MNDLLTPTDIERLAAGLGISMREVLRRSGVSGSVFNRWKNGATEPNLTNYRRLRDTVLPPSVPVPEPAVVTMQPRPKRAA